MAADAAPHAHVVPPLYPDVAYANPPAAMQEQRKENEARPTSTAIAPDVAVAGVEHRVRIGNPGDEIVRTTREVGADLIVLGMHRRHGLDHLLGGGTAARAPAHAVSRAAGEAAGVVAARDSVSRPRHLVVTRILA